jgi:hypothetical protein
MEGRGGRIFHHELDRFRFVAAEKLGDHGKAEIDPAGDAAGGDQRAVAHDAARRWYRAKAFQEIERIPMARGLAPFKQPGRAQNQRAGANRGQKADFRRTRYGAPTSYSAGRSAILD